MNDSINPWDENRLLPGCMANMMGVECEGHTKLNFHVGKFESHKGNGYCYITWKYEPHLN